MVKVGNKGVASYRLAACMLLLSHTCWYMTPLSLIGAVALPPPHPRANNYYDPFVMQLQFSHNNIIM